MLGVFRKVGNLRPFRSCLVVLFVAAGCAETTTIGVHETPTDESSRSTRLTSWTDLQVKNIVMQTEGFTCGAASIATLISYYYGDELKEADVLDDVKLQLNESEIERRRGFGLNLLDLKDYANRHEYIADGYNLTLGDLRNLKGPVIVHLDVKGYKHFAVLRGFKDNYVFLADPWRGNVRMPIEAFNEEWTRRPTLVLKKTGFTASAQHGLSIRAESPIRIELRAVWGSIVRRL